MITALFGKGQKELKILYVLITLTLAAILLYPLGCVLFQSILMQDGGLGFSNYSSLLSQGTFWTALGNSFTVSGISAAIATVMAFFCAYGLHFTRIRPGVKKIIQIIVLLPLFLPSITYGFAVIYSFGRLGLVSQLLAPPPFSIYGFWGLLIADVIYTLPPAFLILYNAFFYVDRNFITVSKLMGAIPNFGEGAVIAMAMLVPSVASVVMLRWVDRFNFRYNKISKGEVSVNNVRDGLYLGYYLLISLALLSVFVVMFVVPFVKQWPYQPFFTLDVITRIVNDSSIWQVYEHSVFVALVSAAVGTLFCYAAALVKARSQLPAWCQTTMDSFAMITNTVPGMVLGIGFLFAMSGTPLANTFTILVLANLVHFFTTPYMMATSALSKMNAGWETTGALMGDSWIKTVSRVIVPNSLPTLLQMFQYFFVSAMVTISAVVFLTGARTMLLTTKIKELQYFEKFEEIFVLSLLVFMTNVAAKLIFDALSNYAQNNNGQGLLTKLKLFLQSLTAPKASQSI